MDFEDKPWSAKIKLAIFFAVIVANTKSGGKPENKVNHEHYFREMFVQGQSVKCLRLENIALYGITNTYQVDLF